MSGRCAEDNRQMCGNCQADTRQMRGCKVREMPVWCAANAWRMRDRCEVKIHRWIFTSSKFTSCIFTSCNQIIKMEPQELSFFDGCLVKQRCTTKSFAASNNFMGPNFYYVILASPHWRYHWAVRKINEAIINLTDINTTNLTWLLSIINLYCRRMFNVFWTT